MKLVPFFLTEKQTGMFTITKLSLFLSHAGKSLWQTEEQGNVSIDVLKEEYLEPNGMEAEKIQMDQMKQIAYVKINPKTLCLSDFYAWEEAMAKPSRPECWRNFYFVQDKEKADWWSAKGLLEAEIPELGNVATLFFTLQDT
jgi:hypothetical protein